jgi:hypothetical protein
LAVIAENIFGAAVINECPVDTGWGSVGVVIKGEGICKAKLTIDKSHGSDVTVVDRIARRDDAVFEASGKKYGQGETCHLAKELHGKEFKRLGKGAAV